MRREKTSEAGNSMRDKAGYLDRSPEQAKKIEKIDFKLLTYGQVRDKIYKDRTCLPGCKGFIYVRATGK